MTKHNIKRGVSLYSFQEEYFLRQLTLEQCIAKAAEIGAKGIEIIGEQMVPGFPKLTDEFVAQWFGWMDKYGTTPVCHDMFLDTKRYKHRLLTAEEQLESVLRDLKFAQRLGCKVVRILVSASPDVIEKAIPYAEELDIKMGIEVHSPFHFDQSWILRHLEVMDRTCTKHYGFIPDFGMFTSRYPRVQRERFLRLGVRPHIADYICDSYEQRIFAEYIVGNVREMGATPLEIGMAESARHQIWSNPKRLLEHMPRIFHIHAKFYEMQDDYTEYSIPYNQIIPLLIEGGYDGYLSSEYEGNRHIQDVQEVDSVEQVRRQHVMFQRLLGEGA
ncbi:MAG: sugar phosphate isomerase/epimerase [Blastocatellia bacterium]|nr:sugar phosphate isomerase/epimerase [Blastocatellia bacterium]